MGERRRLERFGIEAPAQIQVHGSDLAAALAGRTRDLCSNGVFVCLGEIDIPIGTRVHMSIDLSVEQAEDAERHIHLEGNGTITRREDVGVAIVFEKALKFGT